MAFTVRATAIVPKGFDYKNVRREVQVALDKEGENDKKEFNKTISGWDGIKPKMSYETKITDREASVWIGPTGTDEEIEKWRRIDEGLKDHEIVPRAGTTMVFPWQGRSMSYLPKTVPFKMSSSGSGQKLGSIKRMKRIKHHYITPRLWSRTLAFMRIKPFAKNVQDAINRGMA